MMHLGGQVSLIVILYHLVHGYLWKLVELQRNTPTSRDTAAHLWKPAIRNIYHWACFQLYFPLSDLFYVFQRAEEKMCREYSTIKRRLISQNSSYCCSCMLFKFLLSVRDNIFFVLYFDLLSAIIQYTESINIKDGPSTWNMWPLYVCSVYV